MNNCVKGQCPRLAKPIALFPKQLIFIQRKASHFYCTMGQVGYKIGCCTFIFIILASDLVKRSSLTILRRTFRLFTFQIRGNAATSRPNRIRNAKGGRTRFIITMGGFDISSISDLCTFKVTGPGRYRLSGQARRPWHQSMCVLFIQGPIKAKISLKFHIEQLDCQKSSLRVSAFRMVVAVKGAFSDLGIRRVEDTRLAS